MGCDVHAYPEVYDKKQGQWVSASYYFKKPKGSDESDDDDGQYSRISFLGEGRNYSLFALLAGVRRDKPTPIKQPVGMPPDPSPEVQKEFEKWDGDGHGHTWYTLAELKNFLNVQEDTLKLQLLDKEIVDKHIIQALQEWIDELMIIRDRVRWFLSSWDKLTEEEVRIIIWFDN